MKNKIEGFNKNDIKSVKKDYVNQLLPAFGIFLSLALVLFIYYSFNSKIGLSFTTGVLIALGISLLIFLFSTKKHRLDLKNQKVRIKKTIVQDVVTKKEYEPGSATAPVNFLSLLFFRKIFMREMKAIYIHYLIVDEKKLFLDEEDIIKFQKGDEIMTRWGFNTRLLLGILKNDEIINISKTDSINILYV